MKLDERIARDTANATGVAHAARRQLDQHKGQSFSLHYSRRSRFDRQRA